MNDEMENGIKWLGKSVCVCVCVQQYWFLCVRDIISCFFLVTFSLSKSISIFIFFFISSLSLSVHLFLSLFLCLASAFAQFWPEEEVDEKKSVAVTYTLQTMCEFVRRLHRFASPIRDWSKFQFSNFTHTHTHTCHTLFSLLLFTSIINLQKHHNKCIRAPHQVCDSLYYTRYTVWQNYKFHCHAKCLCSIPFSHARTHTQSTTHTHTLLICSSVCVCVCFVQINNNKQALSIASSPILRTKCNKKQTLFKPC